ncbi:hypothetical protein L1277_000317 [Okibacterium sp. HSC-33S16]|uniref:hypothetical protein n=1 Tax=Okibacterium sp. HSC-33S16 TaxID=2910965 RepID=UPI00209FC8CE|nr:hypothetical protein [Okibacterium sp. HSC-33S16]MCP2030253.1 hypothetical protein [Okibacterium sp. HSC-33S16]
MSDVDNTPARDTTVPVQDQHPQPLDEKVAGILIQEEADLAGHEETEIIEALRQRFADAGIAISEDDLLEQAKRIAGSDADGYSS